ncbi:MAG: aryl-sulfate sulfotransferase [Pseudomonadota bacterium]
MLYVIGMRGKVVGGSRRLSILWVVMAFLTTACDSGSIAPPSLEFLEPPTLVASPPAPLVGRIEVKSSIATRVRIDLSDGLGHNFTVTTRDFFTDRVVSVRGLKANRTYNASVTLLDGLGREQSASALTIITDPLPNDFPTITLNSSDPSQMEPGLTLLDATRHNRTTGYMIMVDAQGDVVWYLKSDDSQTATDFLPSEALFLRMLFNEQVIDKIDFDGNVAAAWHAQDSSDGRVGSIAVSGADFHHDAVILPNGNILTSTRESIEQVNDFPIDENDSSQTGTVTIREEPVIEFAADGEVVGKWDFLDILKPTRIAYDATRGQPNATDWVHLNAIWYDEVDDAILASLRHQDAVVKFSRATGELIWIMGPHANWEGFEQYLLTPPPGEVFEWQYHQHAPMITPAGTILLFDNGNRKASPFTGEVPLGPEFNYSRAVEYRVDEVNMTISQVWEYGSSEGLYTPFIGDADWMSETGNVLITFGGFCNLNGMPSENLGQCRTSGRIIETTYDTKTRVFDLSVEDPDTTTTGYRVYRSERVGSLYPDGSAQVTQ